MGDRVFARFGYYTRPGRIVSYDENTIVVKRNFQIFGDSDDKYKKFKWGEVTFSRPCPFWKFWQQRR